MGLAPGFENRRKRDICFLWVIVLSNEQLCPSGCDVCVCVFRVGARVRTLRPWAAPSFLFYFLVLCYMRFASFPITNCAMSQWFGAWFGTLRARVLLPAAPVLYRFSYFPTMCLFIYLFIYLITLIKYPKKQKNIISIFKLIN